MTHWKESINENLFCFRRHLPEEVARGILKWPSKASAGGIFARFWPQAKIPIDQNNRRGVRWRNLNFFLDAADELMACLSVSRFFPSCARGRRNVANDWFYAERALGKCNCETSSLERRRWYRDLFDVLRRELLAMDKKANSGKLISESASTPPSVHNEMVDCRFCRVGKASCWNARALRGHKRCLTESLANLGNSVYIKQRCNIPGRDC